MGPGSENIEKTKSTLVLLDNTFSMTFLNFPNNSSNNHPTCITQHNLQPGPMKTKVVDNFETGLYLALSSVNHNVKQGRCKRSTKSWNQKKSICTVNSFSSGLETSGKYLLFINVAQTGTYNQTGKIVVLKAFMPQ